MENKVRLTVGGLVLSNSSLEQFVNTTIAVQAIVVESDDQELSPFVGQYLVQNSPMFDTNPSCVRLEMTTVTSAEDSHYKQFITSSPEEMKYVDVVCGENCLHFKKERWFNSKKGNQLMLKVQPNPNLGRKEPIDILYSGDGPQGQFAPLRKNQVFNHYKQQLQQQGAVTEVTAEQLETLLEKLFYTLQQMEE